MSTGPTTPKDDDDDLSEVDGTIAIAPWRLIRQYGLRDGQPVPMTLEDVRSYRDRIAATIGKYAAAGNATSEHSEDSFKRTFGIGLEQLTDGYFERTPVGVQIVFSGALTNGETRWLALGIRFGGGMDIKAGTET